MGELKEALAECRARQLPFRILGGGANVLVADEGFDGAVIKLGGPEFKRVEFSGLALYAGGAVEMPALIHETVRRGMAGLERLGGIPGTVGGCVRMNAGGRFGDIGELVRRVRVVSADGTERWLSSERVGFGYRDTDLEGQIVVGAEFGLQQEDPAQIRQRLLEAWSYKRHSQPMGAHSAGCIFRNPPGDSAGRLIDRAGLKGLRCGTAHVSEQHANFIVADEGARAGDVIELIRRVRERVYERYEVRLELEIDVW
jgi:UDP-N-acetylmuramate dehydrogenase